MSRLMGLVYGLTSPETRNVRVEKNLRVPMPDGVELLADRYHAPALGSGPTVLIRTAYGKDAAGFECRLIAERGFQVLIQSCRGTDQSGGVFDPFRQEHADGVATVTWLRKQPWFDGTLGMTGASYLGYTQWALASDAEPVLKAMSTQTISSDFHSMLYNGGALALEVWLGWLTSIHTAESAWKLPALSAKARKTVRHLPLAELDQVTFGRRYDFWRTWLEHETSEDDYWALGDFRGTVPDIAVPNHMIGGWYDFLLPNMMRDYDTLVRAGHTPYLTIGPWTHFDSQLHFRATREGIAWLRGHLLDDRSGMRKMPVLVYVSGASEWRELPAWPPQETRTQRWYLQPDDELAADLPPQSTPDHYRYDPQDPTPSVGGAGRTVFRGPGPQDNRKHETRADVLTYSSPVLDEVVEILGQVTAELFVGVVCGNTLHSARSVDRNLHPVAREHGRNACRRRSRCRFRSPEWHPWGNPIAVGVCNPFGPAGASGSLVWRGG